MLRKRFYINCSLALGLIFCSLRVVGQVTHVIDLPIENIRDQRDYDAIFNIGNYQLLSLTVGAILTVIGTDANFEPVIGNGSPIPVGVAHLKLASISGLSIDLLSGVNERQLTLSERQTLWSTVLNLSVGIRSVTVKVRLVTAGRIWEAGSYQTGTNFRISNILGVGNYLLTRNHSFEISVPAYLAASQTNNVSLLVNSFDAFRQGISSSIPVEVTTTVPYQPAISAPSNAIVLSDPNGDTQNSLPVDLVNVHLLNKAAASGSKSLQSDEVSLTAGNLEVPSSNKETLNYQFSISAANLKTSFAQAGTYSTPLSYSYIPASANTDVATVTNSTSRLNIVVDDMAEMDVTQKQVELSFTTADHYKQGVSVQVPNHLTLSNTTPYKVYVRSESSSFTADNGDHIPLDVIEIAPMGGQMGVNTVKLSNTAQELISGANPVIDRNISLEYRVPASETHKLLDRKGGIYSTSVVFSFVEP